jgi:hypothetical protein
MAAQRGTFFWGGIGALAIGLAKGFEAMGDSAFASGDRGSALTNHSLALGLLIAAIVCGWKFSRALTASPTRDVEKAVKIFAEPTQREPEFDPDEALNNYLAKREAGLTRPVAPPPPSGGFGRRGL